MNRLTVGFALTGSYCTFSCVIPQISELTRSADVVPFMSENAYTTDTRFGTASDFIDKIQEITGKEVIHTIKDSEPVGPKNILDAFVIAPCTGNTLAKIANGITDTSVTMAAKATLRNHNPLIIAVSTNDALGANAKNLGQLLNTRGIYFVPFTQDAPEEKPESAVADFSLINATLENALLGRQIQPILL